MSYFKGIGKKSRSFGGRKLPLIGLIENKKYTIFNEYVPGSGVGASSVASRRLKKQRAYNKQCVPSTPPIKIVEENGYIDFPDDDVNINNDLIQQNLEANPTANIDLNTATNINTDFNVVLEVANSMNDGKLNDNDRLVTEKVVFSDYNIIDENAKNNEGDSLVQVLVNAGFIVTLNTISIQQTKNSSEFMFSIELLGKNNVILTEYVDYN